MMGYHQRLKRNVKISKKIWVKNFPVSLSNMKRSIVTLSHMKVSTTRVGIIAYLNYLYAYINSGTKNMKIFNKCVME